MPRKPSEPKPRVMWAVVNPFGNYLFVDDWPHLMRDSAAKGTGLPWRTLYRRGWRCVRVEVRPVNTTSERSKR